MPATIQTDLAYQQCLNPSCGATFAVSQVAFACPKCGDLLDVIYDWDRLPVPKRLDEFAAKWADRLDPLNFSGVWRFRELLPFAPPDQVVTIGEGQTLLQAADKVGQYVGMDPGRLFLQYEGMNPSGSFKDNGMSAAFTHARMVGARRVACASTGNTSAALAVYCSATAFGFQGDHLHWLGQDRLRQAGPGARPRRVDRADRWRLRRRDAKGQAGRRPVGHLPDELGQPVPARRPENDHVPGARSARVGSARLDRRARRQPWQLVGPSARRSSS